MEGKPTKDPAFNLAALWIPSERAAFARSRGYTVVDAVSVLGTHFSEVVRRHAHELFNRQDTKSFCDRVAQNNPKVVEDLVPKMLPLSVIQRVLQNLLRERVPIRDGVTILEALSEGAQMTKNSDLAHRVCPAGDSPPDRQFAPQRARRSFRVPDGALSGACRGSGRRA